jgi:hypothetical protein
MNKVFIEKTPNADTRSLKVLDKDLVYEDTLRHIEGVGKVLDSCAYELMRIGTKHDYTKIEYFNSFFEDISSGKTNEDFKKLNWWRYHLQERHHLNDRVPDDVNLFDVLEMLVDCVCAGKARTGEVYPINLDNEILQKALNNTVELLKEKVVAK